MKLLSFKGITRFFNFLILILILGCSRNTKVVPAEPLEPTIILISLDGFRSDYLDKVETNGINAFVESGVKAEALIPVFPSKTFPNHYTQVTGLYPDNHGIIANTMYDPDSNDWFSIGSGSSSVTESKWYGGEPIWVTAELQGLVTAAFFWPGSEAEIKGIRPTYWKPYDGSIPNEVRVEQVLSWLDLPATERPQLITLYMSDVDNAGHSGGPDSEEVINAVKEVDQQINLLRTGLLERNMLNQVNIIIISDHGMAQLSRDRVIFLDDYINLDQVTMINWSPVAMIMPEPGQEENIYQLLKDQHPDLRVFRKGEIPAYLNFNNHRLIPPIIGIAGDGWSISSRDYFNNHKNAYTGGTHGYDFTATSMHGLFVASGPAFKENLVGPPFQSVHLYELMCKILELTPAENDGDSLVTAHLLEK
jgi:predicted AlkP superfamily pyrophosphatase or phosphodiesterase